MRASERLLPGGERDETDTRPVEEEMGSTVRHLLVKILIAHNHELRPFPLKEQRQETTSHNSEMRGLELRPYPCV